MTRREAIKSISIVCLFATVPAISSCSSNRKAVKAQKAHDKRIAQRRKEGERALSDGKTRHMQAQSKETRKRMQDTRRRSQTLNKTKRKPFYARWWDAIRGR